MKIKFFICLLVSSFFFISPVFSENVPTSEEVTKLQEQNAILAEQEKTTTYLKKIAEAELAIETAKRDKKKLSVPTSEAEGLEGTITPDDKFGYFSNILSYQSMLKSTKVIAEEIDHRLKKEPTGDNSQHITTKINRLCNQGDKILIMNTQDFVSGDLPILQINQQLDWYNKTIESQSTENTELIKSSTESTTKGLGTIAIGLSALSGTLGAVSEIAAFFKTDYTIKSQTIKIQEDALNAATANELIKKDYKVLLSGFIRVDKASPILEKFSKTITDIINLNKQTSQITLLIIEKNKIKISNNSRKITSAETKLQKAITDKDQTEITRLEVEIETLYSDKANIDSVQRQAEKCLSNTLTIVTEFTTFGKSITTIQGEAPEPLLISAVIRENLKVLGVQYLLYLSVASSGGEAIVAKKKFSSGNVSFLAGSVIVYVLSDANSGNIISSNTLGASLNLHYKLNRDNKKDPFGDLNVTK